MSLVFIASGVKAAFEMLWSIQSRTKCNLSVIERIESTHVVVTHRHRPRRRSSCRGSKWPEPRRMRRGWCGSGTSPCRGPAWGPGRPAWPSATGHSSRGVRHAAFWTGVSCPPRQILLTFEKMKNYEKVGHRGQTVRGIVVQRVESRWWKWWKIILKKSDFEQDLVEDESKRGVRVTGLSSDGFEVHTNGPKWSLS